MLEPLGSTKNPPPYEVTGSKGHANIDREKAIQLRKVKNAFAINAVAAATHTPMQWQLNIRHLLCKCRVSTFADIPDLDVGNFCRQSCLIAGIRRGSLPAQPPFPCERDSSCFGANLSGSHFRANLLNEWEI